MKCRRKAVYTLNAYKQPFCVLFEHSLASPSIITYHYYILLSITRNSYKFWASPEILISYRSLKFIIICSIDCFTITNLDANYIFSCYWIFSRIRR